MATTYYGSTESTRGALTYSTSQTNTAVTITLSASLQAQKYYHSGYKINALVSGKTVETASAYVPAVYGSYTTFVSTDSYSKTYSRGKTAKTVVIGSSYSGVSVDGWAAGSKSGSTSVNITIPALPSYAVTYNANGGSGAPSNQTKWYGETLVLSTSQPTRSGYTFLGWATSSSATSAQYQSGQNYTSNAALELYAVWEVTYTKPTITGYNGAAIPAVYRCNADGTAADDGTYANVSFSWSTFSADHPVSSIVVSYKLTTSTVWTTATTLTPTGTSGDVVNLVIGGSFGADYAYQVQLTVSDNTSPSSFITSLSRAFFPLDIGAKGKSIGIGTTASENPPENGLLTIGMTTAAADITQNGNDVIDDSMLRVKLWSGDWSEGSITVPGASNFMLFVFRTKTATAAQNFTAIGFKVGGDIRLLGGRGQNGSQYIIGIECSASGDTFSDLVVTGITHTASGSHGAASAYNIYEIYGIC